MANKKYTCLRCENILQDEQCHAQCNKCGFYYSCHDEKEDIIEQQFNK